MLKFKRWGDFHAEQDETVIRQFLRSSANEFENTFKEGMRSPKHGRIYYRTGGRHQASAPGEYPAVESGALLASIDTEVDSRSMIGGTNTFYSGWLRGGTRMMARRKMSDNALSESLPKVRHLLKGFVKWVKG